MPDFTRWGVALRRLRGRGRRRDRHAPSGEPILGRTEDGAAITWPAPTAEHSASAIVLGSSGAGKTLACASALVQELAAQATVPPEQRNSLLVADPIKGDLVKSLLAGVAAVCPDRLADVNWLAPFEQAFALNLCRLAPGRTPNDIRAGQYAELAAGITTGSAPRNLGSGPRQLDALTHLNLACLESQHPAASLLWSVDALISRGGFKALASLTSSSRAKMFLENTRLSPDLLASCASRQRWAFARTGSIERMFSASSCLSWSELLRPGAINLLCLADPPGGAADSEFQANLHLRLAIDSLLSRPTPWPGHHVRIVIDEFQIVASVLAEYAEMILTTGRSRGVSLTVLSQGTSLIHEASPALLQVLLTNATSKFIGRLAPHDAELLARAQGPKQGTDESIASVRARFAASVCNLQDRTFFCLTPGDSRRFRTADVDLAAWQEATEARATDIAGIKARHALPADTRPRVTLAEAAERPRSPRRRPRPEASPPDPPLAPVPDSDPPPEPPAPGPRSPRSRWG